MIDSLDLLMWCSSKKLKEESVNIDELVMMIYQLDCNNEISVESVVCWHPTEKTISFGIEDYNNDDESSLLTLQFCSTDALESLHTATGAILEKHYVEQLGKIGWSTEKEKKE